MSVATLMMQAQPTGARTRTRGRREVRKALDESHLPAADEEAEEEAEVVMDGDGEGVAMPAMKTLVILRAMLKRMLEIAELQQTRMEKDTYNEILLHAVGTTSMKRGPLKAVVNSIWGLLTEEQRREAAGTAKIVGKI
jgi:hypothetical protein